jgi:uncharacterized protein (DUF1684 family)
MMEIPEWME